MNKLLLACIVVLCATRATAQTSTQPQWVTLKMPCDVVQIQQMPTAMAGGDGSMYIVCTDHTVRRAALQTPQ